MKKVSFTARLALLLILATLAACGGKTSSEPVQMSKAVITLSATGTLPAGTSIFGAQATVGLPSGVTAKASPSNANPQVMVTDNGVVEASGQASGAESVSALYSTASPTSIHQITLTVVKSVGFSSGEFATINCDIADGSFPAATDFIVTDFKAVDQFGVPITGLTAGYAAALK